MQDFTAIVNEHSSKLSSHIKQDTKSDQYPTDAGNKNLQESRCVVKGKENESAPFLSVKEIMQARCDSPLAKSPLPELAEEKVLKENVLAQARPWISVESLIEKLKSFGIIVLIFKTKSSEDYENYRFLMNNIPISSQALLMKANKLFIAHGQGTVYVNNITL